MSNIKLYNTGTIYKLYGIDINNNEVIYIGSTVNALCNRIEEGPPGKLIRLVLRQRRHNNQP
jgi:hypothetical protein